MSNHDDDAMAAWMFKITLQALVFAVAGIAILTFKYPKVMLPMLLIGAIILFVTTR